jgi:hypothetical protein
MSRFSLSLGTAKQLAAIHVAFALAILCAGCGENRPTVYRVKGKLLWQGRPAVGAVVFLHLEGQAVDNQNPAKGRKPTGTVGEDGTFELSTYGKKDGAPAGRYRISVIWAKNTGNGDEVEHMLPEHLMNPATSNLPVVEVGTQATELAPIELSS